VTLQSPIGSVPFLQRARGVLNISARRGPLDVTRLVNLRQQGSFRAVFPRPIAGNIEAVIVNTAGGITGGDTFSTTVTAHQNAHISLTTQAAERIYRASDLNSGCVHTTLTVEQSAQLFWVPQETILFDGARLQRRLDVNVHPTASFLMVEPLVFGRVASGEIVRSAKLDDRVSIISDNSQIYLDRVKLSGDITSQLARTAVADGAQSMASIVFVNKDAKALLDPVRALLPATAGASLLNETVLVVRILAVDSFALRTAIFPILTLVTRNAVPKNWRL